MPLITINKTKFINNLDRIRDKIGSKDKICLVLKNNAYGHGISKISLLAKKYGINKVYVKNDIEAKIISKFNFESIIILDSKKKISNKNTSWVSNSLDDLINCKKKSRIELKIDTGLHRNGINKNDLNKVIKLINIKNLVITGVFTHFRSSEENDNFISLQERRFVKVVNFLKKNINQKFRVHCGNSHSINKISKNRYDFFRIGIMAYGYSFNNDFKLEPILSLYANKISSRVLNKNDTIGYGSKSFIVKRNNFLVSTYDLGYGDGFFRLNEKQKYFLKNGRSILGRVSMDSISVEGDDDKILIFDDATVLSEINNTIVYEITTSLKDYIKRVIIK